MQKELSIKRRRIQSITWLLVPITIIGGLIYPPIGFIVPAVMLMAIVGGFIQGRYVCGWLCPRGAFYDRIMKHLSPNKNIPTFLRNYKFRWAVFVLLMGFMVFQISLNPSDPYHWGVVFLRICIITTGIGIVLSLLIHPRTWCTFCPMGTFQSAVSGKKKPLKMDEGCLECKTCEKSCPMDLQIVGNIKDGILDSKDCLKCPECSLACPKNILNL